MDAGFLQFYTPFSRSLSTKHKGNPVHKGFKN